MAQEPGSDIGVAPAMTLPSYLGAQESEWSLPDKILGLFKRSEEYLAFVEDYEDNKRMLDRIKQEWQLI